MVEVRMPTEVDTEPLGANMSVFPGVGGGAKLARLKRRKVAKERIVTDVYLTAQSSVGLPVDENSEAVAMLRFVLRQLLILCQLRATTEGRADDLLSADEDYQ